MVEVRLATTKGCEPSVVVKPGRIEGDLLVWHFELARQHLGGALHAVAQPDGLDPKGGSGPTLIDIGLAYWISRACGHSSRMSAAILSGPRSIAVLGNAARAKCVADRLVHPILARDVDVVTVSLDTTDLEGADHEVGAVEGRRR